MFGLPACVLRYQDAGKRCSDSSQCEGRCLANGDSFPAEGKEAVGECQPTSDSCGCWAEIRDGRALRPVCVD